MSQQTGPLESKHNRSDFNCGVPQLDNYLKKQANQDVKKGLSICFVLTDDKQRVIGYHTLSNYSIDRTYLPDQITKKFPQSYDQIPATLLGRLAIDTSYKGKGLGERLLLDALKRSYDVSKEQLGSIGVIVDPIDDSAKNFNKNYGFIELPDCGKMFLPMKTIAQLF